ncbi:MAG: DUF4924 family protein [Rikenellaceae bacterium]
MDTAQRLRHENIAEYILYIWQLEDLIRALQFSPEAIYSQFVAPRTQLSPQDQTTLLEWYVQIAELLQKEEKEEKGHIEHTLHLIADLHNLHLQLLKLPIGARYRALYAQLEEAIPDLRAVIKNSVSDTELCFRALYATILYRVKGEGGKNAVADTIEYVSPVIAELAQIFRKSENGEIDLFKKE